MNFLEFIAALAWPAVVLIVGYHIKEPVVAFLGKVKKAGYKDFIVDTNPLPLPSPDVPKQVIEHLKMDRAANWYWLGNDMFSISASHLTRADRASLDDRYSQTLHHMRQVGLDGSPPYVRLVQLWDFERASDVTKWSDLQRNQIAQQVFVLAREIGDTVVRAQADYKDRPESI